ncbi:NfeD family protein [Devosia sp. XJ19-1]|uniref:NfeD family protein n=1 Tax=Devosia ureilytica TaxID=2952754 RepID=A0A9Q4AN86_9HYPH|nr:NfeD family protein [Devosia ureilytica]MCP8882950.1 NfeD family protein [Devosia ureilytica]MCP8886682.1 NfeD family protein [Devosia ureilytica]
MQIIQYLGANGPWSWIVAGLVLLALELVVPGGFLLWMGIAGILTGILVLFQPLDWPVQWLVFGVLSLASILVWVRLTRNRAAQTDRPLLNQRAEHFIGQEAVLDQPITGGFGRLALDDTVWRIAGPDLPAGQRVRITGADGAVLRVEPV